MGKLDELRKIQMANSGQRNILKYSVYANSLLEIGSEAALPVLDRQYGSKIHFRPDLEKNMEPDACIRISPELDSVWEVIKREKRAEECRRLVREFLERPEEEGGCKVFPVRRLKECVREIAEAEDDEALEKIWFATTETGIDIRPGLYKEEDPEAMLLGDDCVHALMAGRTGAGKSNALHAIITGLMYEYAPWELNINLADFKIVEMSKYGNTQYREGDVIKQVPAPHVGKIAATDSMEYVLSVMYDMYEKMDLRQKVFAALGVQKLSQYRKLFGVVLPREILIVDEFQQMYELATPKQTEIINQLIKMITKLGRATGYHLFFASQSMTGTVRGDVLANFKLRLCLPASEEVSSLVLGNKAAARLTGNTSRGYLIANAEGGAEDFNKDFKVPLLRESEELGDLGIVLKINAGLAKRLSYDKGMDFYREEVLRPLWGSRDSLEADLERFHENTREAVAGDDETEDFLLLGDSCVYAKSSGKRSTLEYTPLKIGDRKNIICIGDSIYQRTYMLELLALQYGMRSETNRNFIVHGDQMVKSLLKAPKTAFEEIPVKKFTEEFVKHFEARDRLSQAIQLPAEERTEENLGPLWQMYQKGLGADGQFQFKRLKTMTFWVNGFHMLSDLLEEWSGRRAGYPMAEVFKRCTNMGIRLIMVGTKAADLPPGIFKSFGYYFIQSSDETNFIKMSMQKPKEYKDTVLRFKAVNEALNRQKPSLYILMQEEKLVKVFDIEIVEQKGREEAFFRGIG